MNYNELITHAVGVNTDLFSRNLLTLEEFPGEPRGVKVFVHSMTEISSLEMIRESLITPQAVNWKVHPSNENDIFVGYCSDPSDPQNSFAHSMLVLSLGDQLAEMSGMELMIGRFPYYSDFLIRMAGSLFPAAIEWKNGKLRDDQQEFISAEDSWVFAGLLPFLFKGGKMSSPRTLLMTNIELSKVCHTLVSKSLIDLSFCDDFDLRSTCALIPLLGQKLVDEDALEEISGMAMREVKHPFGSMDWKDVLSQVTFCWNYGMGSLLLGGLSVGDIKLNNASYSWGDVDRKSLRFPDNYNERLFLQSLDFVKHKLSPVTYHYFSSLRNNRVDILDIAAYDKYISPNYDIEKGDAFARQMVLQSRLAQEYVPYGSFRFAVPSGTIFMGIQEVAVWTDGVSIWVMLSPGGHIVHWTPSDSTNPVRDSWLGFSDRFASALNLFLSALWMDLSTVSQDAFPKIKHAPAAVGSGEGKSRHRHKSKNPLVGISSSAVHHPLTLPRRKLSTYQGTYKWGEDDVVTRIKKRAHLVSGFLRQLPPGWQRSLRALDRAKEFNFLVIPDGYTFVAPHLRGVKGEEDAPVPSAVETEKPIRVKGLATLLTMFQGDDKQ